MSLQELVPLNAGWKVTAVTITPDLMAIAVKPSQTSSICPRCHAESDRIHSHYIRTVADLPWQGRQVVLRVAVRRFRCTNGGCIQRIFCERLPQLSAGAQSTNRLADVHRLIGLALGGEAGSRLSKHLAVPTSPDTLLRRVKRIPAHSQSTPRVLGVDDFAFRRGESYGTILMDLEKRVVVELLPDRAAGTLATWLKAHPGVEIVSRDRASAYAQAAREAAPKATQVADRFHLLMNLRKAVERSLARQSSAVRKAFRETGKNLEVETENQPLNSGTESLAQPFVSVKEQAKAEKRAQRQERFEQVRQLHREGVSLRQIATSLRMHFVTVQKYVRAEECPVWRSALKGVPAPSPLDPFHDQIRKYVEERRVTSARSLFRDLKAQGYPGGYGPVQRRVHRLTQQDRRLGPRGIPHATRPIADAKTSEVPEFRSFAASLLQDEAAVRAGMSFSWSNGPVEGAVNRLKLIKRSMFGRAGFKLLKARVLNAK